MIDDMRSWFGRAEFDPLWVLRRFWFVEEEDRFAAVSDEVLQLGVYAAAKFMGAAEKFMGDHREIHGSWVFGVEALRHVSSFYGISITKVYGEPERAQCRLLCLVYIRCLFCEASGTSSIGCFVCDLHRFSIKLNGSVKHWKTWYAYFKYTTRMGYVPPPRRLRYRTNLCVIVGLVQRIDDVLLRHNCILKFVSSQI